MPVYPARVCVFCNLQTIMVCVHLRYDSGDYIKSFKLLLSSFSVIEEHNKQCTEPVTTCNTPCVHFSHNGVAARNCIAITNMNKHSAISCP